MGKEIKTDVGTIIINEELIAMLAGMTVADTDGIAGMVSKRLQDGIVELLGRENLSKGVEVKVENDELHINLHVVVFYGKKIVDVARGLMNKVKSAIEETTGLKVSQVNVFVEGIKVAQTKGQ